MIDIGKGVCPYCLDCGIIAKNMPSIFATISCGSAGKLYLCKEHLKELASTLSNFCKKEKIEIEEYGFDEETA